MKKTFTSFLIVSVAAITNYLPAQQKITTKNEPLKSEAIRDIQNNYNVYKTVALQIWDYAEVGYKEVKSSGLLQKTLAEKGFDVKAGVAGIPTAFVATYGSGKPVIGIIAEFDALPGLSQDSVPFKQPLNKKAGHGCGHHLFGTASVAAGIEIQKLMAEKKLKGTIKVFGCPAEEGGSGKVYMVREELFKDVDAVLDWHPADKNEVSVDKSLANISAKFRFHGLSAHASAAPERGRSALEAVEAMDNMVNMMRQHVPQETRIHYVITSGGKAPNVVPDFAEVYYYVRNPDRNLVKSIFERVVKASKGAALGTETTCDYEIIGGTYEFLINHTLAGTMQKNLQTVGGVSYTPEEVVFGKKIQSTYDYKYLPISSAGIVTPLKGEGTPGGASTDVGDVSWSVPTIELLAATWIPGTPAHSWQAVACGGNDIGIKGMMVAAKTLTLTAIDLYTNPVILENATAELKKSRGEDFQYKALLGDRKPALNYRD